MFEGALYLLPAKLVQVLNYYLLQSCTKLEYAHQAVMTSTMMMGHNHDYHQETLGSLPLGRHDGSPSPFENLSNQNLTRFIYPLLIMIMCSAPNVFILNKVSY